ncbi:MAG: outer membrane beta-barrel protein, partial [Bacteroidota bacterium]|nr:outer membrane beta-barrel protein [Bacteroidota bacterium]MDX5429426.1 outer membrane beta-barrel protein [Bacteroidota bacterium]MDX5468217.1 outer membrane beta-barrel protein [Bacteroidota bacterium]
QKRQEDLNQFEESPESTRIRNLYETSSERLELSNSLSYDWKKRKNRWYIRASQEYMNSFGEGGNAIRTTLDSDTGSFITNQNLARYTDNNRFSSGNRILYERKPNDSTRYSAYVEFNHQNGINNVIVNETDSLTGMPLMNALLSTDFHYQVREGSSGASLYLSRGKSKIWARFSAGKSEYQLKNLLDTLVVNRIYDVITASAEYERMIGKHRWSIEFELDRELPNYWQLLALTNNTDPNQISMGNPNLMPTWNVNIWTEDRWTSADGKKWMSMNLYYHQENLSVVSARSFDELGRSVSQPVNLRSELWTSAVSLRWSGGYRLKLKKDWSLRPMLRASWEYE